MKRIILAVLLSLFIVPGAFAGTGFISSLTAAQKQAKQKNQLIFVDLFAQWCGWCHRMERDVFPSEPFKKVTRDMVLLRLDTEDRGEGTEFARRFKITSLPTFLILAPDLSVIGTIRGYAPPQPFADKVTATLKEHDTFLARVKNEGAIAKDPRKRLDLAVEFLNRHAWSSAEPRLSKLTTDPAVPVEIRDEAFYRLAVAQFSDRKYAETLGTINRLKTLKSKSDWAERTQFLSGHVYLEQGKLREARAEFQSFKTIYPASALSRQADHILPQIESALARAQ